MIAKYLATSLAMLKVVSAPRVMSICLPVSTTSSSLVGLESRSTMLPASLAAWVPVFMATATSACASAGASLVPSPVMATSRPSFWISRISFSLVSGVACARKSSTPASALMAAAVSGLSPVIMMVLMPIRRSSANRSRIPPLTMSLSWMTPRTLGPSATTSGVAPAFAIVSTVLRMSAGTTPPSCLMWASIASAAPFRTWRPFMFTPLMRVCAAKGTKVAPSFWMSRSRIPYFSLARTTMLRPSGVSSAREASCAASARSRSAIPGAGKNCVAWRLPRVMVPVLSRRRTSTSPAASTARPDMAMTFFWIMRSIPAIPIADSRAPIVVGMRQTSRATRTVTVTGFPCPACCTLYEEKGNSVAVASRKTMVRPASRMSSAISLGVFCRFAPSTRAIIRSRNASPGSAVTFTMSQSERTWVPPVTELRSPPLSRITGALSPVMALSLTEATPSTTSPSAGMKSPVSTSTTWPLRRLEAGTTWWRAPCSGRARRLAWRSRRALRSDAAWAFPRPSAMASAKLAKSTVNQSQTEIQKMNPAGASPWPARDWIHSRVVRMEPTYTTNMTGFRTWRRTVSLRKESITACRRIGRSNSERPCCALVMASLASAGDHVQMLDDRTQGERRHVGQRSHEDHDSYEQDHEKGRVRGQGAGSGRDDLLSCERAGDRQHREGEPVAAEEHAEPEGGVVEGGVGAEAAEGAPVVVGRRGKGVEDLAEPVRAGVQGARPAGGGGDPDRGADQHQPGHDQYDHGRHLHLVGLDLLAEVLGRPSDHEARHEHGHDRVDQHAVEPGAYAAEDHLAQLDHRERHEAPDRGE